jgi:hypothetical protein
MEKELKLKTRIRKTSGYALTNIGLLLTGFFLGVGWFNQELNLIGFGIGILSVPMGMLIEEL